MNLTQTMSGLGNLATWRQLQTLGFGRHAIERALNEGRLVKVRPGWLATRAASQLSVIAVLQGGRLTSATALASYGVWSGDDRHIHVQIPANAHRTIQRPLVPISEFVAPSFVYSEVVRHWAPSQLPKASQAAWRVTVRDALMRFARNESDEQLAAAIESAVHQRLLSRSDVAELFHRLPARQRPLSARLTFRAESGLETIAHYRLSERGYRMAQQVQIGHDRVDLVIDGWLVIELDGDQWHDPVADRIRTNRLIRAGYRVLRFGYAEIFGSWEQSLMTIEEMLGDRHPIVR